MMNQKAAVIQAVSTVLANAGISTEGTCAKAVMTKELRAQVNAILFQGFRAGEIEADFEKDDAELKSYVSGLQSNWLNKAKELNGDVAYVAKNPGSRAGSTDPQVKALRALKATKTDAQEVDEIEGYIEARLAELGTTKKAKTVQVNFADLPAELQAKYGSSN
jgi:hypothetical protein